MEIGRCRRSSRIYLVTPRSEVSMNLSRTSISGRRPALPDGLDRLAVFSFDCKQKAERRLDALNLFRA